MKSDTPFPIFLMPVKLETRFVNIKYVSAGKLQLRKELWVRIFPDRVFLNSFNPNLSSEESKDLEKYVKQTLNRKKSSANEIAQKEAWQFLVSKYGVYRASWLLQAPDANQDNSSNDNLAFFYQWLPDYFRLYLYSNGEKSEPIDLANLGDFRNRLQIFEEADWLTDFDRAVEIGMAIRVPLESHQLKFDRIIVVGLRGEGTKASTKLINELIDCHLYTEGFSFLEYGTPTNNVEAVKSGYSSRDEYDAPGSFSSAVKGIDLRPDRLVVVTSDEPNNARLQDLFQNIPEKYIEDNFNFAQLTATGLGLPLKNFKHVDKANLVPPRLHHLVQKATWFAMGGQALEHLLGDNLTNETHEDIWNFYSTYVKNRGPLPAIKIGDLPYGILPVAHIRGIYNSTKVNIPENGTPQEKRELVLAKLFEKWLGWVNDIDQTAAQSQVPRLLGSLNPDQTLVEILSMEPVSSFLQTRVLELERMKNVLPDRFENPEVFPLPNSIFSFPPKLVEAIVNPGQNPENADFDKNLQHADSAFNELDQLFGDFLSKPHLLRYSPILTFRNAGSVNNEDLGNLEITPENERDWYKNEFLDLVLNRLKGIEKPYDGKTDFLLFELLNESFYNALRRYDKVVTFQPELADVKGIVAYQVDLEKEALMQLEGTQVSKGDKIFKLLGKYQDNSLPDRTVLIRAPFDGTIDKVYLQAGKPLADDRQLFRLRNEEKREAIKLQLAALQAQTILEIERIKTEGGDFVKAQEQAVMEALDLNSFRLDAWLTGLAYQRIDRLRKQTGKGKGVFFGAYGWVEDLEERNPAIIDDRLEEHSKSTFVDQNDAEGGIIHAPSSAQAVTSAMFRQSFSTYKGTLEKVNPFTLSLTSNRIRRGKKLMDGLRQDQELEALLGYQLERFFHDQGRDELIYPLRASYPLTINKMLTNDGQEVGLSQLTVINALDLAENYQGNDPLIKKGIDLIEDVLDGSADLLFYEAGFQMLQGDFAQAAAAADAAKGEIDPSETLALKTRIPGTGQTHKLTMLFHPPSMLGESVKENPKAFIEPTLEQWLKDIIGDLALISCDVTFWDTHKAKRKLIAKTQLSLDRLNIGYLDLFYLCSSPIENDASELEQRIIAAAKDNITLPEGTTNFQYEIGEGDSKGEPNVHELVELLLFIHSLFKESRSLRAPDLNIDDEATDDLISSKDENALRLLKQKLAVCIDELSKQNTPLSSLAKYDIQNAKGSVVLPTDPAKLIALQNRCYAESAQKSKEAAALLNQWNDIDGHADRAQILESVAKILFGKPFKLLIPFHLPPTFQRKIKVDQKLLVGSSMLKFKNGNFGGLERIRHWLDSRAAVSPQAESFADFLMMAENWTSLPSQLHNPFLEKWKFNIAQYTGEGQFPWIALDEEEIQTLRERPFYNGVLQTPLENGKSYPQMGVSVVSYLPDNLELDSGIAYGLFIDQFSEFIPNKKVNTGVAFQYDAPNNEAPQALLLAAPSDSVAFKGRWEIEDLRDIIHDTMDLTKVRMVDADAVQKFGYTLPMTFWLNIPSTI